MKSLIVTVAGTATRFNKDTQTETLKCIYYREDPKYCLLSQILLKSDDIDEFIIVGGYLYDKLKIFLEENLRQYADKIKLVFNPNYNTYGSGYSLIKGIENLSKESKEVIFVEGDLFFDRIDFNMVKTSTKDVLTINHELIIAKKAVVLYEKLNGKIQYLYDISHKYLEIKDPFVAIYNSAQIWKFTDIRLLENIVHSLTPKQIKGTNLEIIQGYFDNIPKDERILIPMSIWYNCNTVADYELVYRYLLKDGNNK